MSGAAGVLALDPYVRDWADLLLRWLHVIAAIAWIGTSFYFVLLDQSLRPPKKAGDEEAGVGGELWEVHGGGFYHVQKYKVAPQRLPQHLAWFKWEAYTTWLSGFGLLIVLYYVDARANLVDPTVADLSTGEAVAISVGLLAAAWIVYDLLCRILRGQELWLGACILGLTTLAAWGTSQSSCRPRIRQMRSYTTQAAARRPTLTATASPVERSATVGSTRFARASR